MTSEKFRSRNSKVYFERTFGCEVDVELLKSIKMGDEICLIRITLRDYIWQKETA